MKSYLGLGFAIVLFLLGQFYGHQWASNIFVVYSWFVFIFSMRVFVDTLIKFSKETKLYKKVKKIDMYKKETDDLISYMYKKSSELIKLIDKHAVGGIYIQGGLSILLIACGWWITGILFLIVALGGIYLIYFVAHHHKYCETEFNNRQQRFSSENEEDVIDAEYT